MCRVRASQYILVRHGTLRIVDYPSDGVYSLLEFGSQSEAYRYLQRFARNPSAMARLEELADGDEEEDEDEEEEDDEYAGRSRPAHAATKKRDILAEVAELIADEEVGVAEEVHRSNPPTILDKAQEAKAQEQPPTPKQEKKLTFIEIKIMDDQSGKPVNWVRLVVKTPDGNENFYTTDANGLVRIDDLEQGTCDVRCDLKNAKLADTLNFVGTGEPKPPAATSDNGNGSGGSTALRIAQIEIHKVKKGESIASLAAGAGMKWQDLAKFNWDTDVPTEINKHLRDEVGCTKKTKDGYNYMFDDSDDPGLMYIPKEWKQTGLATGSTHVFRVQKVRGGPLLRFVLESSTTGHLLPFHPFVVYDLSNNKVASGKTNDCALGSAQVPKDGDYLVKPGDEATFKVGGTVHYGTSKSPLKSTAVEVRPWDCETLNVTTSEDGEIQITDVPAGDLVIAYQGKEYHVVVSEDISDGFFFVPGVAQPTPDGTERNNDAEAAAAPSSSSSQSPSESPINPEDY